MNDIRSWLYHQRIEPILFKPVIGADAGFEIAFNSEEEAQRFRRVFASSRTGRQSNAILRNSIDCAAYEKQPGGSYVAKKNTALLYSDATALKVPKERR